MHVDSVKLKYLLISVSVLVTIPVIIAFVFSIVH